MNEQAILQLKPSKKISNPKTVVLKAIKKLEMLALSESTMDDYDVKAHEIYNKMMAQHQQKAMDLEAKVIFLTNEYLSRLRCGEQGIISMDENVFSLNGHGTVYVFDYFIDWRDESLNIKRRRIGARRSVARCYDFLDLPVLTPEERLDDIFVIEKILRGLDNELGPCWSSINFSTSPSSAGSMAEEE